MKKSERCLAILDILQKQHKVEVNDLARRFDISEMTVRRDLNFLACQYNITRTHGGAELGNQPVVRMISFDEARIAHRENKEKIAALAATMIRNGQRIFVDAGSTTRIILNYLAEEIRAVVVVNHLKVAEHALQFANLSVIMLTEIKQFMQTRNFAGLLRASVCQRHRRICSMQWWKACVLHSGNWLKK